LWRWAAGAETADEGKSDEQIIAEESARCICTVRENVLWFLRRNLEQVAEVQRGMVEKRIERIREKEKSVLYKSAIPQEQIQRQRQEWEQQPTVVAVGRDQQRKYEKASTLSDQETATIESQLSAEQLQLFAEENDMMLRHYEDTLSKVQYVPSPPIFSVHILISWAETRKNPSSKSPLFNKPSSRTSQLKKNSSRSLSLMHPQQPRM
jgi:hypothetical protein